MSAIEASVNKCSALKTKKPLSKLTKIGGQVAAAAAKGVIKQAINRYAGEDTVKEISEILGTVATETVKSASEEASKTLSELYDSEGKALLEKFHTGQKTIAEFKKQLGEVIASFKSEYERALFILIDELDRCRPPYAVALLERVKHLFEVDNVVFVMATDTDQLRHSIGAIYGLNFAAGRYLLRFFDQTYRFEDASVDAFVRQQFSDIDSSKLFGTADLSPAKFVARAFKRFNLSLRDIEQCTDIIRNCVTVWAAPTEIVLLVLLPLVILQQQRMTVSYDNVRERLEKQLGPVQWNDLDFGIWENSKRRLFDGLALFMYIANRATAFSLVQIANDDAGSSDQKACREILFKEINARFPGGLVSNSPAVSLLVKYPDLVRTVGRLAPA
jgi:hypothetical protein